MKKIKSNFKPILVFYGILFIYLLIITIFNYFEIFNYKVIGITSFLLMIILFLFLGFNFGKVSERKGYESGFMSGGLNIILLIILSCIFGKFPNLSSIIYYVILLLFSIIGGIVGKNYKLKNIV